MQHHKHRTVPPPPGEGTWLPLSSRLTMARRVRAYATTNKTAKEAGTGLSSTQHVTPTERSALRTFGSRGGKKSAQRWTDPTQTEYHTNARKPLEAANKRRKVQGNETRGRILLAVSSSYSDTGRIPTRREIAEEVGCTPRTVTTHLAALREAGLLPE